MDRRRSSYVSGSYDQLMESLRGTIILCENEMLRNSVVKNFFFLNLIVRHLNQPPLWSPKFHCSVHHCCIRRGPGGNVSWMFLREGRISNLGLSQGVWQVVLTRDNPRRSEYKSLL